MMLLAWLMFAPFGILVSRFFKEEWPTRWFNAHRGLQSVALILTIVAAAIELHKHGVPSKPHAIIGVIILAMICAQVGLFSLLGAGLCALLVCVCLADDSDNTAACLLHFNRLSWVLCATSSAMRPRMIQATKARG
jgi:hypothetical protein